jgi:transposase
LIQTGVNRSLSDYIDLSQTNVFKSVDRATAINLFRDFYAPRDAPYDFNFALMSKHALSRIYERYVALLRPESNADAEQLHFINPTPVEEAPSRTGAVYTPQFIAGFFSRYN